MNEVTKKFMCICLRSGVEIWAEEERLKNLISILKSSTGHKFVELDDQLLNTADITGIFNAETMSDLIHRKAGEWKCKYENWHARIERCECWRREEKTLSQRYPDMIKRMDGNEKEEIHTS